MKFMNRFQEQIYAIFRFMFGALFACHGAQKLFGVLGGQKMTEPLVVTGGVIEFVGGLMIALGFFTSIAAFIASGAMAVAYFGWHAPGGFWPIVNKGEMAILYCFAFLYMAARGSGIWSIDPLLTRSRNRRS